MLMSLVLSKALRETATYYGRGKIIEKHVKDNDETIYGAQAVRKQIGALGRPTHDYDILSRRPRISASKLQQEMDYSAGGDFYYTTPSRYHKGTHKVAYEGADGRKGTTDDIFIADFTKPERKLRTTIIGGLKYVKLSETLKDKRKALRMKKFMFRHRKDREDIQRIRLAQKMRRYHI